MGAVPTGSVDLRAENIERAVIILAKMMYKLKPLCLVTPSSSWSNVYFSETAAAITGGTGDAVKGVPRLAEFPYGQATWQKNTSWMEKYGIEGAVSYEDELAGNIDIIGRTFDNIGKAVANAVDVQIESVINNAAGINTLAISVGNEWNSSTVANRDPIQNLLNAKRELSIDNYDPDDGNAVVIVNPTDYANLLGNTKVVNNPTFRSADVVANGVVGRIVGADIVVTNACTISQAYLIKRKESLSWREIHSLKVVTKEDPLIKKTIRAAEIGVAEVIHPLSICKITNTQA